MLSLCGGMDCFAVLAKTWMGLICQHDTPSLRALATKQSILSLWRRGLLRCARNDGDRVWAYSTFTGSGCSEAAFATRAALAIPARGAIFFCGSGPGWPTPGGMIRVAGGSGPISVSVVFLFGT